jgi:cysteine-rich repeat protein
MSPTETATAPADLSGHTIQAYVRDDSEDGFQILDAVVGDDGTFTIPDVPAGSYYLLITSPDSTVPTFYETSSRTPDIGVEQKGRPDGAPTQPTVVSLHLTGMTAWAENDELTIESFATGVSRKVTGIAVGAAAVDYELDWAQLAAPLLDATRGDVLHVVHSRDSAVLEAYSTDELTLVDGQPATVTGAFTVPAGENQRVLLSTDGYIDDLDIPTHHPVWTLVQMRAGFVPGLYQGTPIVHASKSFGAGTSSDWFEAPARDPYPSTWPRWLVEQVSYQWNFAARGTTHRTSFLIDARRTREPLNPYFMSTPMGAVHGIEIGGVDTRAAAAVPFDGTAPVTVTWSPVTGVSHYLVYALRIADGTNDASLSMVVMMNTTGPSATLPASLFRVGDSYVLSVVAIADGHEYADGILRRFWLGTAMREQVTARLLFASSCGNGVEDAAYEQCDSSGVETADCNADCTTPLCGDGILNEAANEVCDDAGDSLLCTVACAPTICGDGHVNYVTGEACDDNNTNNGDGCSSTCQNEPG